MVVDDIDISQKRSLVDRIARSVAFQRSPRLREFLLYAADCTLSDRLEGVREQQIAQNVFNRAADYNAGVDNIVRVEARSLRKRLESYFEVEGRSEPILVTMPKGSYALSFETRAIAPVAAVAAEAEAEPKAAEIKETPVTTTDGRVLYWLAAAALVVVTAAITWTVAKSSQTSTKPALSRMAPFSAILDGARDIYVISSDSALVLIEELAGRQISLDDYINRNYLGKVPGADPTRLELIRILGTRRYTSAPEIGIATQIAQLGFLTAPRLLIRSAHDVQLSDFRNHNAIFLGSPRSNPWAQLFSERLNFEFDFNEEHRGQFRNRVPRAGEPPVYAMTRPAGATGEAFALVALLPNANGDGHVLLIQGTAAEGTEAAGEFLLDLTRASAELRKIGIDPNGPPRYFEILLKVKGIAGSAAQSTVIASRTGGK